MLPKTQRFRSQALRFFRAASLTSSSTRRQISTAIGCSHLFHDMADQADRAREHAKTAHAARREAQLAGKRADCAGRIYRHHAARRSFCARMNALLA
jgi:hypothetical protein